MDVDEKTYYGCCQGCKVRLQQDESIRQAVDPLTGEEVDKATAIAVARSNGSVLYFESEENLKRYIEDSGFRMARIETGHMTGPEPLSFLYEGRTRPA